MHRPDEMMGLRRSESVPQDSEAHGKLARRRRPGEPQREQKEVTRRKLLEAAQTVFEIHPYYAASVDMIAEQAGVSRTTYYRHFDSKLAIALALFANLEPQLKSEWKEILTNPNPLLADVQSWVARMVEASATNRVMGWIFWQIEAIEPEVQANKFRYYEELFEMIPPDRIASIESLAVFKAKFLLLLLQIDQFLYLLCARNWEMDPEPLMKAMAELFYDFLQLRKGGGAAQVAASKNSKLAPAAGILATDRSRRQKRR
jgi:AcrR family transcriptional regulator